MRIELEDTPQAGLVSLTQATLRCALGGIVLLHGLEKLHDPNLYASQLERAGLLEAGTVASVVLWLELAVGVGLILGRFTRSAAFIGLFDLAGGVALRAALGPLRLAPAEIEAGALAFCASCLFIVVGSGPYGLDYILRRRARMRAIAKDEIWSRPPYVTNR